MKNEWEVPGSREEKEERLKALSRMVGVLAEGEKCSCCREGEVVDVLVQKWSVGRVEDEDTCVELEVPLCGKCLEMWSSGEGVLIICVECGEVGMVPSKSGRLFYETKDGKKLSIIWVAPCRVCGRSESGEMRPAERVWFTFRERPKGRKAGGPEF